MVRLARDIQVIGTVAPDQDHFALVGPLVAGPRRRAWPPASAITLRRGQVLAEIESAEVGEARAALIAAKARTLAAEANLRRETDLAERRISSSRERELAQAQWVDRQGRRARRRRAPARDRPVERRHRRDRSPATWAGACRCARRSTAR